MQSTMGNEGVNKLAAVFQNRMHRMTDKPEILDFGVIQEDMSLLTNRFPRPIPQTDYMVCRQLTLGEATGHLTYTISAGHTGDGTHTHGSSGAHQHTGGSHDLHISGGGSHQHAGGAHTHPNECPHIHDVLIPDSMRSLMPGDRVLVAWVGDDACVVDIVLPAAGGV